MDASADSENTILGVLYTPAQRLLGDGRGSHDWEHTLRVLRLCRRLGPAEGCDMAVLSAAALLHDIGRHHQDETNGAVCHGDKGAELAAPLLAGLPLTGPQRENVLHCIRAHRYRNADPPATIEARVLYDADKLDAIGAVGVARAFLFAGEVGAALHTRTAGIEETAPYSRDDTGYREFRVKLRHIRERMLTDSGRRLAAERHRFMEAFFARFLEELEGKA
jgi:uncharacterized protein